MARTNIDASQILDGSIASEDLKDSSVTQSKISICRPYSNNNAYVSVEPGIIRTTDNSGSIVFNGGMSSAFGVVNPGNARYDLLCLTNSGVLTIIQGTESSSPVVPTYPNDRHVLAEIYVNESSNVVISPEDIKDVRGFISMGGGTGSGDNLGNHVATQNITLGSNYISNDGSNAGLSIDSNNYVVAKDQLTVNTGMYGNLTLSSAGINYPSNLSIHSDGVVTISAGSSGNLKMDNSSGNIGINISSPQYKLDVSGSINITGQYLVNGVPISSGSSSSISLDGSSVSIVDIGGSNEKVSFSLNTVEKAYITSSIFNIYVPVQITSSLNVSQDSTFSNNLNVLNDIYVGDISASDNVLIYANITSSNKPFLMYNRQDQEWSVSHDGIDFQKIEGLNNIVKLPSAANISSGQAVYYTSSGINIASKSSSSTAPAIGILTESVTTGNSGKVQLRGVYQNNGYSFSNIGKPVFLSSSGGLTQTPPNTPGEICQVLGIAIGSDMILINPDYTMVEV